MARPSQQEVHPRERVLKLLQQSGQPMTAYNILEKLKKHGINAAPVVYRALDALQKKGLAHRIHALGAYIACNCRDAHAHELTVLALCGQCKSVEELHNDRVIHQLEGLRQQGVRLADHAVIELPVICSDCAAIG